MNKLAIARQIYIIEDEEDCMHCLACGTAWTTWEYHKEGCTIIKYENE